jgi:small-conductance mechanosensitive channel
MDFLFVFAQDGAPRPIVRVADRLFEKYPPTIAIPAFVVGLALFGWLLEKLIVSVVRRITVRTETKVDDAVAAGLPSVLRPMFVIAGLHAIAQVLLRIENSKGETELTQTGQWVTTTLSVVTVLVLGFCIARLLLKVADAWVESDATRQGVGPPIKFAIKVMMVPITVLIAAEIGGAQITSLLAAASVPALAVGLALQDTLKNVIAGVQIVLDQPIRAGDFVEVDKNARGTVLEIGLRSTKLRSPDNNTIIIPNATIANAIVTNLDYADRSYIQTFVVSVAYGSDTRRVEAILEDEVEKAAKAVEGIVMEPHPAALRELGDSGVIFAINVRFRQWAGRQPLVTELYHRFYSRLGAEGIEIPFPTRTLHLKHEHATASAASPPSR